MLDDLTRFNSLIRFESYFKGESQYTGKVSSPQENMTPGSHYTLVYNDWGRDNILGYIDWVITLGEPELTATPLRLKFTPRQSDRENISSEEIMIFLASLIIIMLFILRGSRIV